MFEVALVLKPKFASSALSTAGDVIFVARTDDAEAVRVTQEAILASAAAEAEGWAFDQALKGAAEAELRRLQAIFNMGEKMSGGGAGKCLRLRKSRKF